MKKGAAKHQFIGFIFSIMISSQLLSAQPALQWAELPALPHPEGWAGMFAGVSRGVLFGLGGANFPDKKPWEGGRKKWYDGIYRLEEGKSWVKLSEKLPFPLGYGITVSYQEKFIIVGGSTPDGGTPDGSTPDDSSPPRHSRKVIGYEWDGRRLRTADYPDLPVPLANMAGSLLGDLIVVAGGSSDPLGPPLRQCYVLDLSRTQDGWQEIDPWPGPERNLPLCAVHEEAFFLFSGENVGSSAEKKPFRHILQDAYKLNLTKSGGRWTGTWKTLAPMPRGASAAGTPLPVVNRNTFLLWGGVDAVTALYQTPATHPGITRHCLFYHPDTDTWEYAGEEKTRAARVTLPVVFWNNRWVYVSGEIKAGVRTNTVVTIRD